MSDLRQAAQKALEALEVKQRTLSQAVRLICEMSQQPLPPGINDDSDAITALRAALAEPEQEPVAWNWMQDGQPYSPAYYGPPPDDDVVRIGLANGRSVRLLYTAPTPRRPLTDWEMVDIYKKWNATPGVSMADFARAIERAHGIG